MNLLMILVCKVTCAPVAPPFKSQGGVPLSLFTVLCSALLDSMIVGVYFLIRISIMTAQGKFKPVPSPRGALVTKPLEIEM